MGFFYVIGCIAILIIGHDTLLQSLKLIILSAFNPSAAGGGFTGITVIITARYGVARGLFSNESGLGSAPIVAASSSRLSYQQPEHSGTPLSFALSQD